MQKTNPETKIQNLEDKKLTPCVVEEVQAHKLVGIVDMKEMFDPKSRSQNTV